MERQTLTRWVATLCFALFGSLAQAGDLPALYSVARVAADDTLNVRQGPSGKTPIIGELAHNARNISVVQMNEAKTWGMINLGERSGWVSMAYMQLSQTNDWYGSNTPLACYGTEPFWSLSLSHALKFKRAGYPDTQFTTLMSAPTHGILGTYGYGAIKPGQSITAAVSERACNDGMSDRNFALAVQIVWINGNDIQAYSGCCALQAN